jgi:hypothetical protein
VGLLYTNFKLNYFLILLFTGNYIDLLSGIRELQQLNIHKHNVPYMELGPIVPLCKAWFNNFNLTNFNIHLLILSTFGLPGMPPNCLLYSSNATVLIVLMSFTVEWKWNMLILLIYLLNFGKTW